uniref:Acylglycerol kinase n=1 Tax=Microcebus murinus TaxID=30608 RepID=A0A8C5W6R8_MICMU
MTVFFKTLRNHWKKTTAGLCLLTWGGHWLYGKHCDNLLRRAACQECSLAISPPPPLSRDESGLGPNLSRTPGS